MKELTYNEFVRLAKENYNNGGITFAECWEEYQFNDYVKLFGAITEQEAMEMFEQEIHFHHINPSERGFPVSSLRKHSLEKCKQEADKSVCLCANCHTEYHYLYGQTPENPVESLNEYLSKQLGERKHNENI